MRARPTPSFISFVYYPLPTAHLLNFLLVSLLIVIPSRHVARILTLWVWPLEHLDTRCSSRPGRVEEGVERPAVHTKHPASGVNAFGGHVHVDEQGNELLVLSHCMHLCIPMHVRALVLSTWHVASDKWHAACGMCAMRAQQQVRSTPSSALHLR